MHVVKYHHLNDLNFSLTNNSIIYSNDILINEDLKNLIESILKNKNPDPKNIIFEDTDFITMNKDTKVFVVPSLFDLRKNVLNGSKNVIAALITNLIETNKFKNETLNLLQNYFQNFNFGFEFPTINSLYKEIFELTNIKMNIQIDEAIEKYFMDNFSVLLLDNFDNPINDDSISLQNSRLIYLKIIELLSRTYSDDVFFIFENPFFGLDWKEMMELKEILSNINNKITILNVVNEFSIKEIKQLSILVSNVSMDVPKIINS
jgi:hypothetical protein